MDDFLLDPETGDIKIQNGDLVKGDGNGQHINDILQTVTGEYKLNPFVGCDLYRYLKATGTTSEVKQVIKKQLELDGFTVFGVDVSYVDNELEVVPHAERV